MAIRSRYRPSLGGRSSFPLKLTPRELPARPWARYGSGFLIALFAAGVGLGLQELTGSQARPFSVLVVGVVVSTWLGGFGAGMAAAVTSAVAGDLLFEAPGTLDTTTLLSMTVFAIACVITAALVESLRHSRFRERTLSEAIALKDEFVGFVSHELRNPATVLLGNTRLLQRRLDGVADELSTELLQSNYQEIARLADIIENLLVLARLDHGAELDLEPVRIDALLRPIVQSHRARHPARPVTFESVPGCPLVVAHEKSVHLVFGNLLSNAEKYSPDVSTPIEVRVGPGRGEVVVVVLDRGVGVGELETEAVFEPFYRSPAARDSRQGFGLGLAVSRRLVELQGGRIWARPREGGGSEFGFSLPALSETDGPNESAPPSDQPAAD